MTDRPAVAIYAALSRKKAKRDKDDRADEESVESQTAKVTDRLDRLYGQGGYDVLGEFDEVGHSGSKKNRGPELEFAIAAVTEAANDHRVVELWANTSARFARGTGKRDEARAIGELYYDLRRRGVALRTVEDDEFVSNEMLVGFASAQASKYAKDLSESVTRAKRVQAKAGQRLGGPLPLGYVEKSNPPALDPATAPTVERIHELGQQGVPDGLLARTVNKEGHRSRARRPFYRSSIQAILLNPIYAGLIIHDGEEFDADPAYPRLALTLGALRKGHDLLDQADTRLQATVHALASVPAHAPRDGLLDFAIGLRDSIRGKTTKANSTEEVNRALVETFDSFVIWDDRLPRIPEFGCDPTLPTLPDDEGVHAGSIKIDPSLRPEVVQALLAEYGDGRWPDPPLEWIEAVDGALSEIPPTPRRI